MKKTDANFVKKETAILVTIVALVIGFLGGIFYSALKSPSGTSQYSGSQTTGQSSQNVQQQTNRALILEQEIVANPDNVNALIELGDIYLDSNRYENAISTFVKAEQLAPTNFHILNDLGTLYLRTGNFDTALEKFEAVLKIDPTHIHSLYYVGLVHRETGNTEKALQVFEEVLGLNPDPQLADAVGQEIAALKDQPLTSSFPGSEFNQAK
ncbi:tetratricopeptide repeat protein [Thermodesulfobacteriota bacterium]